MKPIAIKDLTPPQRRALNELWRAEEPAAEGVAPPVFPGAIGHAGCALVRKGLAEKLGEFRYTSGHRFIRYRLTAAGRSLAAGCAKRSALT